MKSETRLLAGGMVMLGLATSALVVVPYLTVRDIEPSPGLKPYTSVELRGRQHYIANGCVYCHSQQPRAQSLGPDAQRGWGRASVAGDYVYDSPHLLGSMRTGPDLLNIGAYPAGSNPDFDLAIACKPVIDQLIQQGRSEVVGKADFEKTRKQLIALTLNIANARKQLAKPMTRPAPQPRR